MKKCFSAISIIFLLFLGSSLFAQTINYSAGSLDVDVTVQNACQGTPNGSGSITFTVNTSSQPSANLSVILGPKNLLVAQVIPVGGSFTFDDSGNGLPGGTYDFIIADGTDNINTFTTYPSVVVQSYSLIDLNIDTQTDNSSCSSPNGTIEITLTGGSGSYNYTVTGPGGFSDAGTAIANDQLSYTTLLGGTYTFLVNDDVSTCFSTVDVSIDDPVFTANIDSTNPNTQCSAPFDGTIDVSVTAGSGSYSYSWTGPNGYTSTSEDITALESGAYSLTITDLTTGCTLVFNPNVGDNTPTISLTVASTTSNTNCATPNGAIDITPQGGSGYTFAWTGPGGFTSSNEDISGLESGSYTITLTDVASGCFVSQNINVIDGRPTIGLTIDSNIATTNCTAPDGAISITPSGGSGYTFAWTGPGGYTSSSEDITSLLPGDYDITVTDVTSACTYTETITVADTRPVLTITVDTNIPSNSCATPNGSISISVSGGTSYTYSWTGPGGFTSSSEDISGLVPGTYDLTVTEVASTCTATLTGEIVVDSTPTVAVTIDNVIDNSSCTTPNGAIDITPSGGTSYSFSWTGPGGFTSTAEDISGLAPGTYDVVVTDDVSGCSVTGTADVIDISPTISVVLDSFTDDTNCIGFNGSLEITASGGTSYTYSWTGPGTYTSTNEDIFGLEPGDYTVVVTEIGSGCTVTDTYNIADNRPTIVVNVDSTTDDSSCITDNGAISITASGGTSYTYSWTGPGSFSSTSEDISGLAAGSYFVTVTDVPTGCSTLINVDIIDISPSISIAIDLISPNTSCVASNGAIDLTISGGTGYTYSWTGPGGFTDNIEDISSLDPGSYDITVTDILSGCFATTTVVVPDAVPTVSITIDNNTPNTSCVAPNGALDISVSGGTSYTYSWTGPGGFTDTNDDISGLDPGDYDIVVTETTSGCTASSTITVLDLSPTLSITLDNLTDNDNCLAANGSIQISMSGGTGYTYSWTGPGGFSDTIEDISSLVPGTYDITVTDIASGCTVSDSYAIADATPTLVINVDTVNDNTDCVSSNGSIDITVSGATNLSYSWTSVGGYSSTLEDISGLVGDSYTITVTDLDSDCFVSVPVVVQELASPITVTGIVNDNTKCNPTYDGAIDITQTGGTTPSFSWTGPNGFISTSEDISNLEAGSYTVTVTELGCTTIESFVVADISAPVVVNGLVVDNSNCAVFNGSITLTLTGSTGPTSYLWTGPNGFTATTKDISGLEAGDYDVIVTENNCDTIETFSVGDNLPTLGVIIDSSIDNTNCSTPNGAISITATGATNYSYSWTSGAGFTSTSEDITGLLGDTYTLTITDDDTGCTYVEAIVINELASPIVLTETITDNTSCVALDGAISLSVSGTGGSEIYSWTGPNGFTASTQSISGLEPGNYAVTVSETGCITVGNYVVADLTPVPVITIDASTDNTQCVGPFDGEIAITVTGGSGSYSYSWTAPGGFISTSEDNIGLFGNDYTVVVTDLVSSCTATAMVTIANPPPGVCGVVCSGFSFSFDNSLPSCGSSDGIIKFINLSYNGVALVNYQVTIQQIVGGLPVGAPRVESNPPNGEITGMASGNYQYDVLDFVSGMNCSGTLPLPYGSSVTASARDFTDVTCFDEPTGTAVIDATGSGTGNYFFSSDNGITWTQFTPGNTVTGLPPKGFYNIFVAEMVGDPCPAPVAVSIFNLNTEIQLDFSTTDATCANDDGAIIINSVSGGTGNYNYLLDGVVFTSLPAGNTFSALSGGDHSLQVTDDIGCAKLYSITIDYPGFVDFLAIPFDPDCSDPQGDNGAILVTVNEVGNFDVSLSLTQGGPALQTGTIASPSTTSYSFDDLIKGEYYITIQETTAPCADGTMVSLSTGPDAIDFEPSLVCSGNASEILLSNITGEAGTPLVIDVFTLGGVTPVSTINLPDIPVGNQYTISGEPFLSTPDTYEIRLSQDQVFCAGGTISSSLKSLDILNPISASVINQMESFPDRPNGRLTIGNFAGGLAGYDIQINLTTPLVSGQTYSTVYQPVTGDILYTELPGGTYLVEVMDQNGCILGLNVDIALNTDLFVPNIFTPNGDDVNDVFFIRNKPLTPVEVTISNRWGKQVFYSKNYENDWDANDVNDGIYFYTMSFDGQTVRGWVEVQRGAKPGN